MNKPYGWMNTERGEAMMAPEGPGLPEPSLRGRPAPSNAINTKKTRPVTSSIHGISETSSSLRDIGLDSSESNSVDMSRCGPSAATGPQASPQAMDKLAARFSRGRAHNNVLESGHNHDPAPGQNNDISFGIPTGAVRAKVLRFDLPDEPHDTSDGEFTFSTGDTSSELSTSTQATTVEAEDSCCEPSSVHQSQDLARRPMPLTQRSRPTASRYSSVNYNASSQAPTGRRTLHIEVTQPGHGSNTNSQTNTKTKTSSSSGRSSNSALATTINTTNTTTTSQDALQRQVQRELHDKVAHLERTKRTLQDNEVKLLSDLEDATDQLSSAGHAQDRVERERDQLRRELRLAAETKSNLGRQLCELELDLARARNAQGKTAELLGASRGQVGALEAQVKACRVEMDGLKGDLSASRDHGDRLERDLEACRDRVQVVEGLLVAKELKMDDLSKKVAELRQSVAVLREENGMYRKEMAAVQSHKNREEALTVQVAGLVKENERHRKKLEALQRQDEDGKQGLIDQVAALRLIQGALETNMEIQRKQLEGLQEDLYRQYDEADKRQRQMGLLVAEKKALQAQSDKRAASLADVKNELSRLEQAISDQTATLTSLAAAKTTLETQNAGLKSDLMAKSSALSDTKLLLDAIMSEKNLVINTLEPATTVSDEKVALLKQIEALKIERDGAQAANVHLAGQQIEQEAEVAKAREIYAYIREQADDLTARVERLSSEKAELEGQVAKLEEQRAEDNVDGLREELATAQEKKQALQEEADKVSGLLEAKTALESKVTSLEVKVAQLETQASDLQSETDKLPELNSTNTSLSATITALQTRIDTLQDEVAALRASADRVPPLESKNQEQAVQLLALAKQVASLQADAEIVPALVAEKDKFASKAASLQQTVEAVGSLVGDRAAFEAERTTFAKQKTDLEAAAAQVPALQEQTRTLTADLQATQEELGRATEFHQSATALVGELQERIEQLQMKPKASSHHSRKKSPPVVGPTSTLRSRSASVHPCGRARSLKKKGEERLIFVRNPLDKSIQIMRRSDLRRGRFKDGAESE